MLSGFLRIFVYCLLILIPLIIAGMMIPAFEKNFIYQAGKGLALTAFVILMLQPLLAGRFKWIERPFGLDIVLRFHKYMAIFATTMLLFHPLAIATESHHGIKILYSPHMHWPIWIGRSALTILLLSMVLNFAMVKGRLSFERWRVFHDWLSPLLLLLIPIHSIAIGKDLKLIPMQILWGLLFISAAGAFVYHRLIRPRCLNRHRYTVEEVRQETDDVHTLKFRPPQGRAIPAFLPGQFHFITLYRAPDLPVEEHHFTISSSPMQEDFLSSTIKNLGDFTSTIHRTKRGDTAVIHGPFGRFSYLLHPEEKEFVFIAGGIGITPVMSMLRAMRDRREKFKVHLFYGNPTPSDIVFKKELDEIGSGEVPDLRIVYLVEDPPQDWDGESGQLNESIITKHCGSDLRQKNFYICGPPGLMQAALDMLAQMHIPKKRIHTEIFSFIE